MCTGSGSPPAASLAASWSAGSSTQASPVSVEKNTSGPMVTMRPSCSAARRWIERTSLARCKLSRDSRGVVDSCRVLRSVMGSIPAQAPCSRRHHHWSAQPSRRGQMELFTKLFGSLLVFVYHCFDRIVIHGYLSALTRPEQVVYFFRQVVGVAAVDKEVLSRRTGEYQDWVEAFARNHGTPIEWAEKGVRKEDYVQRWLRPMVRAQRYGIYFIFKSMQQGPTFRCTVPKYPTRDPNHRILAPQRSRFTHYYFYIYDQVLGPMVMRVGSFLPFQATYYLNGHSFIEQELKKAQVAFRKTENAFVAIDDVAVLQAAADRLSPQIIQKQLDYWTLILGPKFSRAERHQINLSRFYAIGQDQYCRTFIFKRNFPIHKIFERSCEIGLWRLTANRISELFGMRLHKRMGGKLGTLID